MVRRPDWFDWTAGALGVGLGLAFGVDCWWRIASYLLANPRTTGFQRLSLEYAIDGLSVLATSLNILGILLYHRTPAVSPARLATNGALVSLKAGVFGLVIWFGVRVSLLAATPLKEFPLWTLWCHPCTYAATGVLTARVLLGSMGCRRRRDWLETLVRWFGSFWFVILALKVARQWI